jgi:GNAT superfamily N-acetyltransferase
MAKPEPKPAVPAFSVRLAEPQDEPFVYDSWIRSAHRTYPNMHAVDFCADERARVQRVIQGSVVAVAQLAEARDDLLGHVVYGVWRRALVVHYAFVKPDARRHGVLTAMLKFANFDRWPVVLTAPAMNEETMAALVKRYIYDQRVLPLMQRGGA